MQDFSNAATSGEGLKLKYSKKFYITTNGTIAYKFIAKSI